MSNIDRLAFNRAGLLFCAANVSAKSVVAVSTTATGVILYNPIGSNVNLWIVDGSFAWTTAPAAVHNIGWAIMAPNVITPPATVTAIGSGVQCANGSGNAGNSVAQCYDAATLGTAPVMRRIFGGAVYGSGVAESPFSIIDYVDGALGVQPGGAAVFAAVTTTLVGLGSLSWIELPVKS
jgi:hypothetical protein